MRQARYVTHGNIIPLPRRFRPRLELVGRHDLRYLMGRGFGRKPYNWRRDAFLLALLLAAWAALYVGLHYLGVDP